MAWRTAGCRTRVSSDLAGLDAESAQLDLVVGAAEEADVAVREETGAVAGAVQPVALTRAERVADETFRGQLGPVDVADAEAVPADVQVALDADGARLIFSSSAS